MKKVVSIGIILAALAGAGCASSSPWSYMPYEEASSWQAIGVSAYDAGTFRSNGFTPSDTKPWIQSGIKTPETVIKWHQAGFTAKETAKWQAKDIPLIQAIEYKKKGLTVE